MKGGTILTSSGFARYLRLFIIRRLLLRLRLLFRLSLRRLLRRLLLLLRIFRRLRRRRFDTPVEILPIRTCNA